HDVVCLIGASGSGKSTLLRCLNLLETVDDGGIWFEGEEVTDPRVDARRVRGRMGMVFQAYNLFPHMSVLDNLTLAPRRVHGVPRDLAEGGTTMVLATHEMAFAREVATRVCFLHDGAILEQGTPEAVLGSPEHERTRQFLRRVLPA